MTDEWPSLKLGELMELALSRAQVHASEEYPIVGVLNRGRGVLRRDPIMGWETKYRELHRVDRGMILYSKLKAFEGAVTVALNGDFPAFASPEFPTFRCGTRLSPEFFALVTQLPAFWSELSVRSTGMGGRRERVSPRQFLDIALPTPPREVQRRIVDLIAAVDANAKALAAAAAAGADLEGSLFQALVARATEGMDSQPLGEVGEFVRGRRFTKDEYVPSGLGCIHYGQIHTRFGPVARKSLTHLPEESRSRLRLARPGDVVIAATSEDLDGLGKATAWLGKDDVAVHDDCYIFRHRLDPKFAAYVFASPSFQQQKRQYAGGTKVTRISGSDLARIAIPIPPIAVQVKVGEALSALTDHENAVRVELDALHRLRTSMTTALLSQKVEIPQAYDRLVDAGVA